MESTLIVYATKPLSDSQRARAREWIAEIAQVSGGPVFVLPYPFRPATNGLRSDATILWSRGRVTLLWAWFDLWIGAYLDVDGKALYLCPVPTICIRVSLE